jgi:Zn-finger nucleic acid-binding protein
MIDVARPHDHAMEHPRHAAHAPAESGVHYARCPQCAETMARVNFGKHSGIVVDVCRWHGTWFDAGELDAAMEFVHAGGVPRGSPPLRS